MKEIKLTQDKVALVNDEDFEYLSQWKWFAHKNKNTFYAERNSDYSKGVKRVTIGMHRVILDISDTKILCDHKDGNGLNNQRDNLRVATHSENCSNRKTLIISSSKYRGVWLEKITGRWRSEINSNGSKINLGIFNNEINAAIAYNEAASIYHGEFANLNIIP